MRALCISLSPSVSGEGSARARETDVESMATDQMWEFSGYSDACPDSSSCLGSLKDCFPPDLPMDSQYGSFLIVFPGSSLA